MNFVGRAEIIESIQSRIAMNQMSLCVVYGPHRSGKSYVASQLVRRHKALYLAGRMANEAIHVADMNRALEARFVPTNEQDKFEPVTSLQEAFEGLFESSVKTPQTVVIDDYPSLVEAVPQFPIHLRDLLDAYKETSRLNIILMANGLEQLDGRIIGDRSLIGPYVSEYFEVKPFSLVDMKSCSRNMSGRRRRVRSMASFFRHRRTFSWWPLRRTSGTFRPCHSSGRLY